MNSAKMYNRLNLLMSGLKEGLLFTCIMSLCLAAYCGDVDIHMKHLDINEFPSVTLFASIHSAFKPDRIFQQKDFKVTEDEHDIDAFSLKVFNPPLNVALVLDTSGSIKDFIDNIKEGAEKFVKSLGESDKILVVEFSGKVLLSLRATFDHNSAVSAIRAIRAGGGTKLYDGIYKALESLDGPRQTVVLFTDGKDQRMDGDTQKFSSHDYTEVIDLAVKNQTNIHCIGVGKEVDVAVLKTISDRTGGKFFHTLDTSKIKDLYEGVARYLTRQYKVTYTTPNTAADGRLRQVTIRETASGTKGVLTYSINARSLSEIKNRQKSISELKKNQSGTSWKQSINANVPGFKQHFNVKGASGTEGFKITGPTTSHLQKINFEYDENGFIKSATAVMTTEKHADTYVHGTQGTEDINFTNEFEGVNINTFIEGTIDPVDVDPQDTTDDNSDDDNDTGDFDSVPEPDIDDQ